MQDDCHVFLEVWQRVANHGSGNINLLKRCWVHEDVVVTILIKIGVIRLFNERFFQLFLRLRRDDGFDTVRNAAHLNRSGRRTFARAVGFRFQDNIKLPIRMLDNIALADICCDFNGHSMFPNYPEQIWYLKALLRWSCWTWQRITFTCLFRQAAAHIFQFSEAG